MGTEKELIVKRTEMTLESVEKTLERTGGTAEGQGDQAKLHRNVNTLLNRDIKKALNKPQP